MSALRQRNCSSCARVSLLPAFSIRIWMSCLRYLRSFRAPTLRGTKMPLFSQLRRVSGCRLNSLDTSPIVRRSADSSRTLFAIVFIAISIFVIQTWMRVSQEYSPIISKLQEKCFIGNHRLGKVVFLLPIFKNTIWPIKSTFLDTPNLTSVWSLLRYTYTQIKIEIRSIWRPKVKKIEIGKSVKLLYSPKLT